jgi:hypothetical protein
LAPPAHAGTYDVQLCGDSFTARNDHPATLATTAGCPLTVAVRPGALGPPPGASAAWTLTAPPGTTLNALRVRREIVKNDRTYDVAVHTGEGSVLESCPFGDECETEGTRTYRPTATRSIAFRVGCAAAAPLCPNAPVSLAITEATATIEDSEPPVFVDTGWQHTAEVVGQDASGVRNIAGREQACSFTRLPPCPGRAAAALDLPDGVHTVSVTAADAAGQSRTAPVTVRVDRVAPAAPIGLSVAPGFVYTWTNPASMAPIVAAHLSDGTVVRGEGITQLRAARGDLGVWLEDAAGNADPETAVRLGPVRPIALGGPVLQTGLRITRTRRSGRTLTLRGTAEGRVTASLTRFGKTVRRSARPRHGRWTLTLRVARRGTYRLTVRSSGVTVRRRVRL